MIGEFPATPDWSALHAYEGVSLRRDIGPDEMRHFLSRLVYLATPYTRRAVDENGAWCLDLSIAAAAEASAWAWRLTRAGLSVVSPIMLSAQMVHDEYAAERASPDAIDPLDHRAWEAWCAPILARCEVVAIPPIAGWDESLGVWREAVGALAVNKTVLLLGDWRC